MNAALQRRLAAVLALDVVGYSRLMGLDEEGTHRRVIGFLEGIAAPRVAARRGRIVKKTGDGFLAEFDSVVEATRAGVEIQEELPAINRSYPADRHITIRMGINLGDIIVEQDDIYGDGVNIAARLEALARPGTICVSDAVVGLIADKFPYEFEDLGYQNLKNIQRPVRAFIVLRNPTAVEDTSQRLLTASPVPGFEGRPAIAVLPFLVGGPDGGESDDYIGDGLAEEVIDQLSSWRAFPVIARNSSFQFRKVDIDVKRVGTDLGARYLVIGTVRRGGGRVRIAARLVDAQTGYELISHRAECALADVFDTQGEIAQLVVGTLEPELLRAERDRVSTASLVRSGSYDLYMRGLWHHYQFTRENSAEATTYFRKAITADGSNAQAYAMLALAINLITQRRWRMDEEHSHEAALIWARRAVQLDGRDPLTHFALGSVCMNVGRLEEAETEMAESTDLNPSYAAAYAMRCFIESYVGRPEAGLAAGLKAMRLSPHDPRLPMWLPGVAAALFHLDRPAEALIYAKKALARRPGHQLGLRYAVASLGSLGRAAEAADLVEQLLRHYGSFDAIAAMLRRYYQQPPMLDRELEALRRAGVSGGSGGS